VVGTPDGLSSNGSRTRRSRGACPTALVAERIKDGIAATWKLVEASLSPTEAAR
jgi:hypothetical protein